MQRTIIITLLALLTLPTTAQKAADTQERTRSFLLSEAMLERMRGQHSAAFEAFRHVLDRYPDCAEANYYLAPYYLNLKQNDKALLHAKTAVSLAPDNYDYLEQLAAIYRRLGQTDNTIDTYEQLWQADKQQTDILRVLQSLYYKKGDYQKAINALERIEQAEGPGEQTSWLKSRMYQENGDKDKALGEIRKLTDQYPADNDYRNLYATALINAGQTDEGKAIVQDILREEPDHPAAQITLLTTYNTDGDTLRQDSMYLAIATNPKTTDETLGRVMKLIIQTSPDSTKALNTIRQAKLQTGNTNIAQYEAAYMELLEMPADSIIPVLDWIVQKDPYDEATRYNLVEKLWNKQALDSVITICADGRKYTPEQVAFHYFQGVAYIIKDQDDNALEAFQAGLGVIDQSKSPELVADFYSKMGDILHDKGLAKQAYAAYDSCLAWQPDRIECLNNYAYFLALEGHDLERAEQMSRLTIQKKPESPTYLDTYAWILFVLGRTNEAAVYIQQALSHVENDKERATLLEHAGDIYATQGDTDRALDHWHKAAELMPDNKLLKKKINKKKYIRQ